MVMVWTSPRGAWRALRTPHQLPRRVHGAVPGLAVAGWRLGRGEVLHVGGHGRPMLLGAAVPANGDVAAAAQVQPGATALVLLVVRVLVVHAVRRGELVDPPVGAVRDLELP